MRIAITGLANSGKTTIFNALTGLNLETAPYTATMDEPVAGSVKVPDERVDKLSAIYSPKKTTYSTIEYYDYMGIKKGDGAHNRKVFDFLKLSDAIVEVARAFEDDSVPHPEGSVDPARDAENFEMELIFYDLELIEKRLERMEESLKKGKKTDESDKKILVKCKEFLEKEIPLRRAGLGEEDLKSLRHLQFLSLKPKIILLDTGEQDSGSGKAQSMADAVAGRLNFPREYVIALCGKVEMELAQLSPEEAKDFLEELGIAEPALKRLVALSYRLLGLICFLTSGEDEVRSWTITKGATALAAAGKIHSDIERGFIRAETVAYNDFIRSGSMVNARKLGLVRLEGKTYTVEDGDIINFRFNV